MFWYYIYGLELALEFMPFINKYGWRLLEMPSFSDIYVCDVYSKKFKIHY